MGLVLMIDIESSELSLWCKDDCKRPGEQILPMTMAGRHLSRNAMQQLASAIATNRPTKLSVHQLCVHMRPFCELVVPHMAGHVKALIFEVCGRLNAADVALLSATLTANAVRPQMLRIQVHDDESDEMLDAVAALCCAAQPDLEYLIIDLLDDSSRHAVTGQRYALTNKLMSAASLRYIALPDTSQPTPDDLLAVHPVDNINKIKFLFEGQQP
jgi:hypothetical protein